MLVTISYWAARAVCVAFVWVGMQTLYAVPAYAWKGLFGQLSALGASLSAVFAIGAALLAFTFREQIVRGVARAAGWLGTWERRAWWLAALGGGLVIRWLWIVWFPAQPQVSDHAVYLGLARRLASGDVYHVAGTDAYWPPGYAMFLAPILELVSSDAAAIVAGNLLLFLAMVLVVYRLGKALGSEALARLAVLLFVLWPNHIALTGLAKKEALQLVLFAWSLLAYVEAVRAGHLRQSILWSLLAGASLAGASFAQPSSLLAPSIFIAYEVISRHGRAALGRVVFLVIGMMLVLAPWTLRNYAVLDAFVPISTNGGYGLYTANNPNATGGHLEGIEKEFAGLDEVSASRAASARAFEWIRENPLSFAKLGWHKQILLLGDDSDAVAWTMDIMHKFGGRPYFAVKGLANLFWMLLVALAAVQAAAALGRSRLAPPPEMLLLALTVLYVYAIDSVAQSGSRHHIFVTTALILLAAGAVRLQQGGKERQ